MHNQVVANMAFFDYKRAHCLSFALITRFSSPTRAKKDLEIMNTWMKRVGLLPSNILLDLQNSVSPPLSSIPLLGNATLISYFPSPMDISRNPWIWLPYLPWNQKCDRRLTITIPTA